MHLLLGASSTGWKSTHFSIPQIDIALLALAFTALNLKPYSRKSLHSQAIAWNLVSPRTFESSFGFFPSDFERLLQSLRLPPGPLQVSFGNQHKVSARQGLMIVLMHVRICRCDFRHVQIKGIASCSVDAWAR